jgi:dihydropteroate synthase
MHSRGEFETMHTQPPVENILSDVSNGLRWSIDKATSLGVSVQNIVLDIGIGFGKTQAQNLELIAKLDKLTAQFPDHPMLVGTSRKSFIGKILAGAAVDERLSGSLATAAIAVWNGARILRVHDVKETAEMIQVITAVRDHI